MCPSTKEFSAIIGFSLYCPLVVPTCSRDMSSKCRRSLGITEECISTIIVKDEVDFVFLISYFQIENGWDLKGMHRCQVILLCLLERSSSLMVLKIGDQ